MHTSSGERCALSVPTDAVPRSTKLGGRFAEFCLYTKGAFFCRSTPSEQASLSRGDGSNAVVALRPLPRAEHAVYSPRPIDAVPRSSKLG
eukprot:1895330-Prymnesium_polylepis.1